MKYEFNENSKIGDLADGSKTSALFNPQIHGGVVEIPFGGFLFDAEYARDGNHLVLTDTFGPDVILENFFSADTLPTLVNEQGAGIDGRLAAKLAGPGQIAENSNTTSGSDSPSGP